jgi:hypothetical protein
MRNTLATTFPDILETIFYDKGAGKELLRLQAPPGTDQNSSTSDASNDPNVKGLALDIFLFANDADRSLDQQLSENLVDLFVYYKEQMRWSCVTYNRVTTDEYGGPKPYSGNPRTTHIHFEWPASRASTAGFSEAMAEDLNNLQTAWETEVHFQTNNPDARSALPDPALLI